MIIRSEQMEVFESAAEDDFVQRLRTHLLENYANSVVRLPDKESSVKELPEDTLDSLVKISIERARSYEMSFESSISVFSAIMFDAAPNFDRHSMSQICLKDENVEPNSRLNELLKILTDEHWEKIRTDYDVNDWKTRPENNEDSENAEKAEEKENSKNTDFAETVMNIETPEKPSKPAEVKKPDFAETVLNIENPNKPEKSSKTDDLDFLDTVVNIDTTKK